MKKIGFLFLALFVAGFCFADPVEGYWLSINDKTGKINAGWHVYQEGGVLFARVLSIADFPQDALAEGCKESYAGFPVPGKVNEMTVVGTPWVFGLTQVRTGEWRGGNVIDPEEGRMYGCRITFRPADGRRFQTDTLEMRGTIGPFGRSQFWTKTDLETASGLR